MIDEYGTYLYTEDILLFVIDVRARKIEKLLAQNVIDGEITMHFKALQTLIMHPYAKGRFDELVKQWLICREAVSS